MTGCVWCKGRTLPDHDCRNFAHLEPVDGACQACDGDGCVHCDARHLPTPENVEELCITCQGVGQLREFDQRHPRPCPDCTPENVEEPTVTDRQGDA